MRWTEAFQGALQDRLPKEFKLAGIAGIESANAFIREVYPPAHNARFAVAAAEAGSAFVPIPGVDLGEILCIEEERQVMNDNCVSYRTLKLQIPPSPMRPHFVKARVKVHVYADGSHALFHGPRCIGRYGENGALKDAKNAAQIRSAARLIFAEWPDVVARPIAEEVERVLTTPRGGGLLTLGAIFSFYFASSAIEALRVGLNRAYGLVEMRPWWLLRLQSLGLVLVGSVALLALAFLVVLGPLIVDALAAYLPWVAAAHELLTFARIGVAASMLATSLILAHLILPAHRPRLRDLLPGVTVTFVASIAFGEAFGFYLSEYLRNYISMYAGLASAMIALVYLYWVALLFVFGGELNASIVRERARGAAAKAG